MRLLPRTLRGRLTLLYGGSLALTLAACGGLCYALVRRELLRHHDLELARTASEVAAVLSRGGGEAPSEGQRAELDRMGRVIVLEGAGETAKVIYRAPLAFDLPLREAGASGPARLDAGGGFTTTSGARALRVYSRPIRSRTGTVGVIHVAEPIGDLDATLDAVSVAMLLLVPLVAVAAPALGNWLARRALAPVDSVTQLARGIEATNLSLRLPAGGSGHEMERLVDTFNQMIARLDNAFDTMRRFTAEASHELRAPLASMRSAVDVVLSRPRTGDEYRETLAAIGEDVDRLRSITDDLLVLARADAGRIDLDREPLRVDSLVADTVDSLLPLAQERGVALEIKGSAPVTVSGDERWLRQLLMNLLDNALKYAARSPGASRPAGVTVLVHGGGGFAILAIEDTGPGLPEGALDRVFDRFFRADPARTYARDDGAGLGLAIAAWIVEAHSGTIAVENLPGGGCRFTVRLPLAGGS